MYTQSNQTKSVKMIIMTLALCPMLVRSSHYWQDMEIGKHLGTLENPICPGCRELCQGGEKSGNWFTNKVGNGYGFKCSDAECGMTFSAYSKWYPEGYGWVRTK